jgi:excisionase family DNA binding protein
METAVKERWLTTEEAAEYLGTNKRWIKANIHNLGIPHVRLGRQFRFRMSDLDKWLLTL